MRARFNLLFLVYAGLSVYFTWPLLSTGRQLGISDWDVLLFYHASVFKSVYEYASLPFWNPWYCGGHVLWQNPQVSLISPVYLLSLVVSLPMAMKLNVLLHYLAGFFGMHVLLTRGLGVVNRASVLMLASMFCLAGGPALHLAVGHATFLSYFYLPWLLAAFLAAIETGFLRYATAAALVVALMLYSGGLHIAFMAGVALAGFALVAAVCRRSWRPLAVLVAAGAAAFLFAAPKLVPTIAFLRNPLLDEGRSFVAGGDTMTLAMLERSLLDPYQYLRFRMDGQNHGWHEYGNYIGSLGVILIVGAFLWTLSNRPWRRDRWLGVSLACTTALMLANTIGEVGRYAPFMLIRGLPLFSGLRVPSRFSLLMVFFGTALAGSLARHIRIDRFGGLWRFVGLTAVLSVSLLAYSNQIHLHGSFSLDRLNSQFHWLQRGPAPIQDTVTSGFGNDSPMTRAVMQSRAIVNCYEPVSLRGHIQADRPIVFSDAAGLTITDISFSPNRIRFRAVSRVPARVFLNERYVDGWRSDSGPLSVDPESTLGYLTLPADTDRQVAVWFTPPGLPAGLMLLALGVLVAIATRKRTIGVSP